MLERVFDIDIERCPRGGGHLNIIAAIEDPTVIERILTHLAGGAIECPWVNDGVPNPYRLRLP